MPDLASWFTTWSPLPSPNIATFTTTFPCQEAYSMPSAISSGTRALGRLDADRAVDQVADVQDPFLEVDPALGEEDLLVRRHSVGDAPPGELFDLCERSGVEEYLYQPYALAGRFHRRDYKNCSVRAGLHQAGREDSFRGLRDAIASSVGTASSTLSPWQRSSLSAVRT